MHYGMYLSQTIASKNLAKPECKYIAKGLRTEGATQLLLGTVTCRTTRPENDGRYAVRDGVFGGKQGGRTQQGWYKYSTQASMDRGLLREVIIMEIGSSIPEILA